MCVCVCVCVCVYLCVCVCVFVCVCVCVCVCSGVYLLGIASQPLGFAGPPTELHNWLLIKPHCNSKVGVKKSDIA